MCLAIPGKVLEEFDRGGMRMAKVQFGGIVREAALDYVPAAPPKPLCAFQASAFR